MSPVCSRRSTSWTSVRRPGLSRAPAGVPRPLSSPLPSMVWRSPSPRGSRRGGAPLSGGSHLVEFHWRLRQNAVCSSTLPRWDSVPAIQRRSNPPALLTPRRRSTWSMRQGRLHGSGRCVHAWAKPPMGARCWWPRAPQPSSAGSPASAPQSTSCGRWSMPPSGSVSLTLLDQLSATLAGIERWLLPAACLLCDEALSGSDHDALICDLCRIRWKPIPDPTCERCGQPRLKDLECRLCAGWPLGLSRARSAVWLEGSAREVVHRLKYDAWPRSAGAMGRAVGGLRALV